MAHYTPTIGLEVHAELKTQTKMFCNSRNDPDERRPNFNVCPICMGHPGTLPVINKAAVRHVLTMGVAVGGQLADYTEFDRKNYFYPDIPKGYQITQYAYPLVTGGQLHGIQLTRIHLEEDTALSKHEGDSSLVDFNRAGIPLMELVTGPVIHTSEDAVAFAKELQILLRYLDICDADMEKGHMRLEANISVSPTDALGTKVEIKNLNSFRTLERALEYEIQRQSEVLQSGGEVVQETRGWNETKQETYSQRKKEYSHDYRYFPEPDLPKLKISEISGFSQESLEKEIGELPWARRERYTALGIQKEDADFFVSNPAFGQFVDEYIGKTDGDKKKIQLGVSLITTNLASLTHDPQETKLTSDSFFGLVSLRTSDLISSTAATSILTELVKDGGNAKEIAEKKDLLQQSDEGALERIVKKVLEDNPSVVSEYKGGKESVIQFLVGQGMKASKGAANPQVLLQLFKKHLDLI